jgi:hypothetical protein
MLVIGTSLRVAPVSEILPQLPPSTPVFLINRELVGQPHSFDVELLGDSDVVVECLGRMLDDDEEDAVPKDGSDNILALPALECSNPSEVAEFVSAGNVVRWSVRPSTFLFRGCVIPPSEEEAERSAEGSEERDHGDFCEGNSDNNSCTAKEDVLVGEEHHCAGWSDEDEIGSLSGIGLSRTSRDAADPSGPSGGGFACEMKGERESCDQDLRKTEMAACSTTVGVEQFTDRCIDEVDEMSSEALKPASQIDSCEYDEEWGIQRPRPGISIMTSCRRK